MQSFDSDGIRIAYRDEGDGEPILLIHGFASNTATNWANGSYRNRRGMVGLQRSNAREPAIATAEPREKGILTRH